MLNMELEHVLKISAYIQHTGDLIVELTVSVLDYSHMLAY